MALDHHEVCLLAELIWERPGPVRALSLGYPDLHVGPEAAEALLGKEIASSLPIRADSEEVLRNHGFDLPGIYESVALFEALGATLDTADIQAHTGSEIIIDLNVPLPDAFVGAYDLVIDPGTLEHCFNVGQAVLDIARMVTMGGFVYHANPCYFINHGYHNLSPLFYPDFYAVNGFTIRRQVLPHPDGGDWHDPLEADATVLGGFNRVTAQRTSDTGWFFPLQGFVSRENGMRKIEAILESHPGKLALIPAGSISEELMGGPLAGRADRIILADSHKAGGTLEGVPILSPEAMRDADPDQVVITSATFATVLHRAVVDLGIPPEKISLFFNETEGYRPVPSGMLRADA